MTIRDDVFTTAALMADDRSATETTLVERLVARGFDHLRAELLVVLVPLGLARAVIARLPVHPPITLSDVALIRYPSGNRALEVRLRDLPEFEIARQLGEETFLMGAMSQEQFCAACDISVELTLVDQALWETGSVGGARIAAPVLLRLTEAPGFEDWYRELDLTAPSSE